MSSKLWCHVFVTDKDPPEIGFSVQWQFPNVTISLDALNLLFARHIVDFIAKTRRNPEFRDHHLGGGRYRRIPTKQIDVSSSFKGATVVVEKDGEFDDSFVIRVTHTPSISLIFDVQDHYLDALVESLRQIVEDYAEEAEST
jgi:hypothetical protein